MRLTRSAVAAAGLLALGAVGPHAQQSSPVFPTPFDGRWKLTGPAASRDFVDELLVFDVPGSSAINVERRTSDGASLARVRLNDPRPRRFEAFATLSNGRLVVAAPVASRAQVTPSGRHSETWSVGTGRLLVIEASSQPFAGAPRISRAVYEFVPLHRTVPASTNLVENGDASAGTAAWRRIGTAAYEACSNNPCFAIRGEGSFQQAIRLPADAAGKHVLIIGSGSTERVNADGTITGLPYLYALLGTADGARYVGHLQGMTGRPARAHQWVTMAGVFPVPADATVMFLDLKQASSKDQPHTGSTAWFDDIAVHVFASSDEAHTFARGWQGRTR